LLNNGNGTRLSVAMNYKSVPNLSLTDSRTLNIEWSIDEDPRGSDHFPIIIKIFGNSASHYSNRVAQNNPRARPKLSLGNFDKKIFPVILQKTLETFPIDLEGDDPLEVWYNLVIESVVYPVLSCMMVKMIKNMLKIIQFLRFQIINQNFLRNINIARGGTAIVRI